MVNKFCYFWLVLLAPVLFSNAQAIPDRLQERLTRLQERVQQAQQSGQHALVESYMGEIIVTLDEMGWPDEKIRPYAHQRIEYSYSAGRLEPARQAAEDWLKRDPNDLKILDMLGTIAFRMNRLLEARDAMQKVYQAYPEGPATQRRYLKVLTRLDEKEASAEVCETILDTHTDDTRSLYEVIESYLHFGEASQAQSVYDRLKNQGYDGNYLRYTQARIWQEQEEWQKALDLYTQMDEGDAYYSESLFRAGLCYSGLRRWEEAAKRYLAFLSYIPEDKRVFSNLEQSLARMRNPEGALIVREIRQAMEERFEAADEALYLERQGEVLKAATLRAELAVKQGLYTQAETVLKEAVKQAVDKVQANMNLAAFYQQSMRANKAEKIYREILPLASKADQDVIQTQLFKAQLVQGKTEDLMAAIESLDEDSALRDQYNIMLGSYYLEFLGDAETAVKVLDEPRVTEFSARPFYLRAKVQLEDFDNLDLEMTSIPEEYRDPAVKLAFVAYLIQTGRLEEARTWYEEVVSEHTDLPVLQSAKIEALLAEAEGNEHYKELESKAKQVSEALPKIRELAMKIHRQGWDESVEALLQLADLYEQIGGHDEAVRYMQMAHSAKPDDAELHQQLIQTLDEPRDSIERLYQIRRYRNKHGRDHSLEEERAEVLAYLGLNP